MGYTTTFEGKFKTSRPLTAEEITYLKKFSNTRRMQRSATAITELLDDPARVAAGLPVDTVIAKLLDDPARIAVGLPIGIEGEYFVGGEGFMGQEHDRSVLNYNRPPLTQPDLWCHWTPTEDGTAIEWDGGEKFYGYIEWIEYIINHFMKRWGILLNGVVDWEGEERSDTGSIIIQDNVLVGALDNEVIEGEFQEIVTNKIKLLN